MLINQLKFPSLKITFVILISGFIFLMACQKKENNQHQVQANAPEVQTQSFAQFLDKSQSDSVIQLFQQSSGDVNQSFLFNGIDDITAEKVVSFKMDSLQSSTFFQKLIELDSLAKNTSLIDSVRIRIQMAFWESQQSAGGLPIPNYVPLIQLLVNQDSIIYPAYPLQAFVPVDLNWQTLQCPVSDCTLPVDLEIHQHKEISCCVAKLLVNEWINIQNTLITEQLYLYESATDNSLQYNAMNRVRYYVFDKLKTADILFHNNRLNSEKAITYFYLHLGKYNEVDWIPMRTVLHLDAKDIAIEPFGGASRSTYFEFSSPCPKYCSSSGGDIE